MKRADYNALSIQQQAAISKKVREGELTLTD